MSKKKKEIAVEVELTLEKELLGIDEEKLPLVLSERLELLEKTNKVYDIAKTREKQARDKVTTALINADELISKAKGAGSNTASTHRFLGFKWTTKSDEIDAIKANLREMVDCGIESAEAQKELVEVQSALAEAQTAILQVQETQMAYQGQIADATKFLYGLSAYNMSSIQSVLINLEAVLSGASKEKLGEMAQQQLLLAMDQMKNQENIILRVRENRDLIDSIDIDVAAHGESIGKISRKNSEQDTRMEKLEKVDADLIKRGMERDKLLQAREEHDIKQDLELAAQAKKAEEHDSLIQAREEHDKKQDLELVIQAKKAEEHGRLIRASEEHDKEQDLELVTQAKKIGEHDRLLRTEEEHNKKQDLELAAQVKKIEEHGRLIRLREEHDKEQDLELVNQTKKIEEHDKKQDLELAVQAKKNAEHDTQIKELLEKCDGIQQSAVEQTEMISELKTEIERLKKEKTGKHGTLVAYAIASVSLLLAIIQFFV